MKYKVEIEETLCRVVDVEAKTSDEALAIVERQYRDCEVVLGGDDFVYYKIQVQ